MSKESHESYQTSQRPLVTISDNASPARSERSLGYSDDQRMIYYGKRQQFKVGHSLCWLWVTKALSIAAEESELDLRRGFDELS